METLLLSWRRQARPPGWGARVQVRARVWVLARASVPVGLVRHPRPTKSGSEAKDWAMRARRLVQEWERERVREWVRVRVPLEVLPQGRWRRKQQRRARTVRQRVRLRRRMVSKFKPITRS